MMPGTDLVPDNYDAVDIREWRRGTVIKDEAIEGIASGTIIKDEAIDGICASLTQANVCGRLRSPHDVTQLY